MNNGGSESVSDTTSAHTLQPTPNTVFTVNIKPPPLHAVINEYFHINCTSYTFYPFSLPRPYDNTHGITGYTFDIRLPTIHIELFNVIISNWGLAV